MILHHEHLEAFGIPVDLPLGIITFTALIMTAFLGMMVMKERYGVSYSMHMNMARLTVVIAVLHALIAGYEFVIL